MATIMPAVMVKTFMDYLDANHDPLDTNPDDWRADGFFYLDPVSRPRGLDGEPVDGWAWWCWREVT